MTALVLREPTIEGTTFGSLYLDGVRFCDLDVSPGSAAMDLRKTGALDTVFLAESVHAAP